MSAHPAYTARYRPKPPISSVQLRHRSAHPAYTARYRPKPHPTDPHSTTPTPTDPKRSPQSLIAPRRESPQQSKAAPTVRQGLTVITNFARRAEAATQIQACYRGFYERERIKSYMVRLKKKASAFEARTKKNVCQ